MAASSSAKTHTISASSDDEIEGLNEKLLKSLSKFKFTLPPNLNSTNKTQSMSSTNSDNDTDALSEHGGSVTPPLSKHYGMEFSLLQSNSPVNPQSLPRYLPPIGVFWDIENCQVPKGRSAVAVTQVIRDSFFRGYREAEFIVVCDVKKENNQVIQELNDAQVNLIHVASTCKNAADEKLRQSIRRFADIHGSPSAIILISGDINFAVDLSDLRHRKKIHVILLHKANTSEALILCANEHYNFMELMEPLPSRNAAKPPEIYDLLVDNLPKEKDAVAIKRRLKQLSDNCGGKVIGIEANVATLRFNSIDSSIRAQKRMDGEDVFGSKILVRFSEGKEENVQRTRDVSASRDLTTSESEAVTSTPGKMYTAASTLGAARSLPTPSHYHSSSPVIGGYSWGGMHCSSMNVPPGFVQPSSVLRRTFQNNGDADPYRSMNELSCSQSPLVWQQVLNPQRNVPHYCNESYKAEENNILGKRVPVSQVRDAGTIVNNERGIHIPDGHRRIRGTHGSVPQSDWKSNRQSMNQSMPNFYFGPTYNGYTNAQKRRSPSPMITYGRDAGHWNPPMHPPRINRCQSPYEGNMHAAVNQQEPSRLSPYHQYDPESEEIESFFNPINNRNANNSMNGVYTPIELQVTNLDQNFEPKEMKRILSSVFMEHIMVLHVSVFMQSDGNMAASVKVPSLQDAQYAISQLHRRKVGLKRILISYAHSSGPNPQLVRSQIVMLLQEVPGHKLPLFKFREMYESRYVITISVSELYKMKDVCIITEESGGRMVALNPDHRNTPSPCLNNSSSDGSQFKLAYCTMHTQKPWSDKGWAEAEMVKLPNVKISLKLLNARIQRLLETHNGTLPLPSLPHCYEAEFETKLEADENGVPLEHLVSCLTSVELKQGPCSVKYVVWSGSQNNDESCHEENKCVSPSLANQLALFSRELVDLLKTAPHSQLPFNRFIPAYHHHFGRQCRVADYGFIKLINLLETLTHTVQVIGAGGNRIVTLSHRAQVRRFTSDLLRLLKGQASKQVTLSEFPAVYAKVIGKPWDVVDYGVCDIEDILSEVSESTVVVTNHNGTDKMIAIPKREQTPEEIERTKQFSLEVIELLSHAPQCRMQFNKFVPSYHHHFGHQCRVSDYGFTKLIELFEAIPDIVRIEDIPGGERHISLTEREGLGVLGEQIASLVARRLNGLAVSDIEQEFLRQYGYALKPEAFSCTSISQLVEKISGHVKVTRTPAGLVLTSVDKSRLQTLALQCRRVLMDEPYFLLIDTEFQKRFFTYYSTNCDLGEVEKHLSRIVKVTNINDKRYVELTPLGIFACNIYRVLINSGRPLSVSQLESAYLSTVGSPCEAAKLGYPTLSALLQALPCTVTLKDTRRRKKMVYLNENLAAVGIPVPSTYTTFSPHGNAESSNESFDSDTSNRLDSCNASFASEERTKWSNMPVMRCADVARIVNNEWSQNSNSMWPAVPELTDEEPYAWRFSQKPGEGLLNSLIRTPTLSQDPTPTPQSDCHTEEEDSDQPQRWFSVWDTPPNLKCFRSDSITNVNVPPFTLPEWNQISLDDSVSSLLSPTKSLLPAAANPLNPRVSPYFSTRNSVVAPHPSELPFPSLSLTPKKSTFAKAIEFRRTPKGEKTVESIGEEPDEPRTSRTDGPEVSEVYTNGKSTPNKHSVSGKRRLAAQFNQPINS